MKRRASAGSARPHATAVADSGVHIFLRATDAAAVRRFHALALANGATNEGAPGERQAALTPYFGAFFIDLDGNRLEAVTFPRPAAE